MLFLVSDWELLSAGKTFYQSVWTLLKMELSVAVVDELLTLVTLDLHIVEVFQEERMRLTKAGVLTLVRTCLRLGDASCAEISSALFAFEGLQMQVEADAADEVRIDLLLTN